MPLESVEHLPAQTVEPEPFEFDPDQIEWLKDWDYKPIQVRLISMVYYEGYSLQEAAELSRVTYANARQIISRAFRQIRKLYPEGYKGRVGRKR